MHLRKVKKSDIRNKELRLKCLLCLYTNKCIKSESDLNNCNMEGYKDTSISDLEKNGVTEYKDNCINDLLDIEFKKIKK